MSYGPNSYYEDLFELNPLFLTPEFAQNIRNTLAGNTPNSIPFPHFILPNFFTKPEALKTLCKELKRARWANKSNDLYSIWRTGELAAYNAETYPALTEFALFVRTHVRQLLMNLTGVHLTEKISVAGSRYDQTDVLLPHDDRMEERKFAFIFYLTPHWDQTYGGDLNLFNCDERMEPTTIAKSITPRANNFLFFDICPQSWHSVSEVVAPNKQRLSLNGWFHCDIANINRNPAPLPPLNMVPPHQPCSLDDVKLWVQPRWRSEQVIADLNNVFARRSEVHIKDFVPVETYQKALLELQVAAFHHVGPPNLINAETIDESRLAEDSVLIKLFNIFRSDAMTLLITQWTGLHLFDMNSISVPSPATSDGTDPSPSDSVDSEAPPTKRPKIADSPLSTPAVPDSLFEGVTHALLAEASTEEEVPCMSPKPRSSKSLKKYRSPVPSPEDFEKIRVVTFLYKFKRGSYTLADDRLAANTMNNGYCFDFLLFFKDEKEWDKAAGGYFSYIAMNEPDEVLSITPRANLASLVFREPDVLDFLKYVNCLASDEYFYVFRATYFGFNPEEDDEEENPEENVKSDPLSDEDDLEEGYVEDSRRCTYRTGLSSSDEDEDVDIKNEPPPLVSREVRPSPQVSPDVSDYVDSEDEEDSVEEKASEEVYGAAAGSEGSENNDSQGHQPLPVFEVDADSSSDDGDVSISSESARSTSSANSAATDDLSSQSPNASSSSESSDDSANQPDLSSNQLDSNLSAVNHQEVMVNSDLEPDESNIDENHFSC